MENKKTETDNKSNHLRMHYEIVALLYALAALISFKMLSLSDTQKNLLTLLSTRAMLAAFLADKQVGVEDEGGTQRFSSHAFAKWAGLTPGTPS